MHGGAPHTTWAIVNSCDLALAQESYVKKIILAMEEKAEYLGVSVGRRCILDDRLVERWSVRGWCCAKKKNKQMQSLIAKRWKSVQIIMLSITDYALFFEPLPERIVTNAKSQDHQCLRYMSGIQLNLDKDDRCRRLTRTRKTRGRRQRQIVQGVAQFRARLML